MPKTPFSQNQAWTIVHGFVKKWTKIQIAYTLPTYPSTCHVHVHVVALQK